MSVRRCTPFPMDLPPLVAAYFEGDASTDLVAILQLFAPDVVIVDDGKTWRGHDGLRAWKAEVSAFDYVTEPTHLEDVGADRHRVTARITGNFPGGQVYLSYLFSLEGDLIRRLEVTA
jgi:SnoaL-like domain